MPANLQSLLQSSRNKLASRHAQERLFPGLCKRAANGLIPLGSILLPNEPREAIHPFTEIDNLVCEYIQGAIDKAPDLSCFPKWRRVLPLTLTELMQ